MFIRPYLQLWLSQPRLLLFGFLAAALSGVGQTYLIGLFNPYFRETLGLSHTGLSAWYAGATLLSAGILLYGSRYLDRFSSRGLTILASLVAAVACFTAAAVVSPVVLFLALLLLRFGGQGLFALLSATAMARSFDADRGRALSTAGTGHAAGEALLPFVILSMLLHLGSAGTWLGMGIFLLLVALPALLWLGPRDTMKTSAAAAPQTDGVAQHGERLFRHLLPAAVVTPFVMTLLLFHMAGILADKGQSLTMASPLLASYGIGHFVSLLGSGPLIDRYGPRRLVPAFLIPLLIGLPILAFSTHELLLMTAFLLCGLTLGANSTSVTALWAELFGVAQIGRRRGVHQAAMVFSTALAPLFAGALFDLGVGVSPVLMMVQGFVLACGALAYAALRGMGVRS